MQLVVRHIGRVQHGLVGQQLQRAQSRQVRARGTRFPKRLPLVQHGARTLEHRLLGNRVLVPNTRRALYALESTLDRRQIGERQFELDDLAIAHRIDGPHHVCDVGVVEATHHLHDRVGLADVRQELVAQPFALRRTFDEAGDIDELHGRGDDVPRRRIHDGGDARQAWIGHFHNSDVGLDGTERVVRGVGLCRCQRVEQRRLSDVG